MVIKRTTNISCSQYWFMMVKDLRQVIITLLYIQNWNNGLSSMIILLKEPWVNMFLQRISVGNIKMEKSIRKWSLKNMKLKTVPPLICSFISRRNKQRKFFRKLLHKIFLNNFSFTLRKNYKYVRKKNYKKLIFHCILQISVKWNPT